MCVCVGVGMCAGGCVYVCVCECALLSLFLQAVVRGTRVLFPVSPTPLGEYDTIGEGRWLRGSDAGGLLDREAILVFSGELDEYEAKVVILERAVSQLPTKAQEQQLQLPWGDKDTAVRVWGGG